MIFYYSCNTSGQIEKKSHIDKGWIFSYDLSADDTKHLINLGLDELILEDAEDYFEVPRFEYEKGNAYFFTRYTVETKDGELSTAPLLIVISERYVITVSHQKPEFLDDFAHNRKDLNITDPVSSLVTIFEKIAYDYTKSIMNIRRTMLKYFGNVGNISEQGMKHFVGLESKLADYMSALYPMHGALAATLHNKELKLSDEHHEELEDLKQDIIQLIDSSKGVLKTIQNIRSAHGAILTHKLNITIKTLTMVTIILTIPTMITGLFGMNTWLPFGSSPIGFLAIVVIIIGLCFAAIWWFKNNKF